MRGRRALGAIVLAATYSGASLAQTPPPPIVVQKVVTDERFGDWTVTHVEGQIFMALTVNSADASFGAMCNAGECIAFIDAAMDCDEGETYPVLINAPSAAYSAEILCENLEDTKIYSLPLEGAIADAMSVGGVIGIAFPMASGEFKVSRFSLTGAARATARASQLAQGPTDRSRQNASDSYTL